MRRALVEEEEAIEASNNDPCGFFHTFSNF